MLRSYRFPAAIGALLLLLLAAMQASAVAPGNAAFQRTWERTDQPVASAAVARTWIWGPEANTGVMSEDYAESPGDSRQVQYYDKSRMEINNPSGDPSTPFYVTNGLLVVELMTGRLQLGDSLFQQYDPAQVNVAGDADDPLTYADLAPLRSAPALPDGSTIIQRLDGNGAVSSDPSLASHGVTAAFHLSVPGIDHQVASPFWTFLNSTGPVRINGQLTTERLFDPWYYATGYPITEAYWANVKIGGTLRLVLLQCFERRCLTYTPGNPAGFLTEAGNVGQHYHYWRYVLIPGGGTPTATADSSPTATGTTATGSPTSTATATQEPATEYEFVTAWGQEYDPTTAFAGSIAVATDSDGNVYVADTDNHRIQKYDSNGEYITGWGSAGSGNSEFNSPFGIAVDTSGNVYVADTYNMRVQKFTAGGAYITQWPTNYAGTTPTLEAYGIAVGPTGNIYVAASIGTHASVLVYSPTGSYVTQLGGKGTGLGQFDAPWAIAFDRFGQTFVADISLDKVQIFTSEGVGIQQFGETGTGDNQFDRPAGIAIDDNDIVYIADLGNGRVQLHATASAYLSTLELPIEDITPVSVALDDDGNLYVGVDTHGVMKFNTEHDYQFSWHDDRRGRFVGPGGIAVAADGTILVGDLSLPHIQRFTADGLFLAEFGSAGAGPGQFVDLVGIAVDSLGQIYVVDQENDRIQKFSAQGVYISQWGSSGAGDGQFSYPIDIAFDADDNAYVTDYIADRVQKFTSAGTYLDQWGSSGTGDGLLDEPQGIAVYREIVYVADARNDRIQAFDLDGNYLFQWGATGSGEGQLDEPIGVAVDAQGYVYVVDRLNHRVQKFTPDGDFLATWGSVGSGDGQFMFPYHLAIDNAGNVYVTDEGNSRVQKFAPVE